MGGGGNSGGTTQQQNQYQSLSPWAQPYITSMLGAAQSQVFNTDPSTGQITGINPYNSFGSYNQQTNGQYGLTPSDQLAAQSSVAGFSPLQQQSYQGASNLQTPGQIGMGTGAAGLATANAFNLGASSTPQNFQNQIGGYMNPYVAQSLAPQLQLLGQQTGINSAAEQSAATSLGAFGGSREALANALQQQTGQLAAQQAIGQGYNTAFNNAQNQYNSDAGFALQAQQAALQGAGQLGQLGSQQLAAQQGILGLQNTYGGQQQQQQQNIINQAMQNYQTAQQYPMQQLGQLKSLISGVPVTDVTATTQQAAPSTASTLAGLGASGIAGLGLYNTMNKPG